MNKFVRYCKLLKNLCNKVLMIYSRMCVIYVTCLIFFMFKIDRNVLLSSMEFGDLTIGNVQDITVTFSLLFGILTICIDIYIYLDKYFDSIVFDPSYVIGENGEKNKSLTNEERVEVDNSFKMEEPGSGEVKAVNVTTNNGNCEKNGTKEK